MWDFYGSFIVPFSVQSMQRLFSGNLDSSRIFVWSLSCFFLSAADMVVYLWMSPRVTKILKKNGISDLFE